MLLINGFRKQPVVANGNTELSKLRIHHRESEGIHGDGVEVTRLVAITQAQAAPGTALWSTTDLGCRKTGHGALVARPVAGDVVSSGAGESRLVKGGDHGVRIRPAGSGEPWSLTAEEQRGEPYLLLTSDAGYRLTT